MYEDDEATRRTTVIAECDDMYHVRAYTCLVADRWEGNTSKQNILHEGSQTSTIILIFWIQSIGYELLWCGCEHSSVIAFNTATKLDSITREPKQL